MSLVLTSELGQRLGAVTEALLSPLRWSTREGWWRETEARMRALFPDAQVLLSIPEGQAMRHYSDSIDAGTRRRLQAMTEYDDGGHLMTGDEATNRWLRWRRATRTAVWGEWVNRRTLNALGTDLRECIWYHDGLVPARLADFVGMTSDLDGEEYFLCIGYPRLGGSRLGHEAEVALFQALVPALRAGHHALRQHAARQQALAATLDAVDDALLVVGGDGRALHRNAALRRLLAAEPERVRLEAALDDAARALAPARAAALVVPAALTAAAAARRVVTATAAYRVRAAHADESMWGVPGTVLVSVAVDDGAPAGGALVGAAGAGDDAGLAALRARHGLTAREGEVAALLGRRLTNGEIAAALGVSPHTARHHAQRVLEKLGVRSRRALGAALREAGVR